MSARTRTRSRSKAKPTRSACPCQQHQPGRLYGRTAGASPTHLPTSRYVRSLGHAAGLADDERLARLERAGMPPAVASHVLLHAPHSGASS